MLVKRDKRRLTSSSGYMLVRGCVPIPRFVIQYNVPPSASANQMRRYNQN